MTAEIKIGKTQYKIRCADDGKKKIEQLAESLNERMNEATKTFGVTDEKTLLVMIALELEEELRAIRDDKFTSDELYESISDNIDNVTSYIEKLTKKVQRF